MKEILLVLINEFVDNVKEVFTASGDGSIITLDFSAHNYHIEARVKTSDQYTDLLTREVDRFEKRARAYSVKVPFIVIIKRQSGKTLIKNTLSPKIVVNKRELLSSLFKKHDMVLLDHLVEDDPKWLGEILQERYKSKQNEDILQIITYLSEL